MVAAVIAERREIPSRTAERALPVAMRAVYTHLSARAGERTPEDTERHRQRRAFWLTQARARLRSAREWRQRFGGFMHSVAFFWYLEDLLRADMYRRWAHERRRP